jgi:hypothetical protein
MLLNRDQAAFSTPLLPKPLCLVYLVMGIYGKYGMSFRSPIMAEVKKMVYILDALD